MQFVNFMAQASALGASLTDVKCRKPVKVFFEGKLLHITSIDELSEHIQISTKTTLAEVDPKRVPELLEEALRTFRERNAQYGDQYLTFGQIMRVVYPDGWNLRTEDDWNRAAVVMQIVTKLVRYAHNPSEPHLDSARDMIVYSAMLEELSTKERKEEDHGYQGDL